MSKNFALALADHLACKICDRPFLSDDDRVFYFDLLGECLSVLGVSRLSLLDHDVYFVDGDLVVDCNDSNDLGVKSAYLYEYVYTRDMAWKIYFDNRIENVFSGSVLPRFSDLGDRSSFSTNWEYWGGLLANS